MKIIIGIDVGGSTTKICGFRGPELLEPLFVKAADPVASVYGGFGKFTSQNGIALTDIERVMITGVGSAYISSDIYGLKTEHVSEFVSTGRGGLYLTGLPEAVIVSMGTGTALVHASGDKIEYLGGTGVGGGVIIDGKIYSGFNYAGAELGHTVIEYNGRQCSCGRKGCFEAYASATALVSMTKEKLAACKDTLMWEMCGNDINKADARIAFAAMKKGDRAGKEVVDMYISYLACGITNMINIFQPEVLLIGGGVCNEKDYLLKPLTEIVNADQYTRNQAVKTEIKIAALGNDAGIVGAAALGR